MHIKHIYNLLRKQPRFSIKRWHLTCHWKNKRVLPPISTNTWNVIGAIVSQTIPRIVMRRQ